MLKTILQKEKSVYFKIFYIKYSAKIYIWNYANKNVISKRNISRLISCLGKARKHKILRKREISSGPRATQRIEAFLQIVNTSCKIRFEVFWRHICEGRALIMRTTSWSRLHLSHHDVWRSLNPHDCENGILTATHAHVVMPPRNRHTVHFTRPVCSPFYCKRISDAAVKWSVLVYTTCAVRCARSTCYVTFSKSC